MNAFLAQAPANPTGQLFTEAQSSMSTTLIPAVVGIVLLGSLFWMGVSWYQKGKKQGAK